MAGNNKCEGGTLLRILLGVFGVMACIAPCVLGDVSVPSGGDPCDIDYPVSGFLDIYGTANLWPGASADYGIYAWPGEVEGQPGATVNIYGCEPDNQLWVLDPTDELPGLAPVVTVYGPKFRFYGTVYLPPTDVPISGLLEVLSEADDVLFSLTIDSDVEIHLRALEPAGPEEIAIDIKPGGYPNSINLGSKGVVPVAILSTDGFDAEDVDPDSVEFAGVSPVRWALEDVDGDGDMDMIFHFKTRDLDLDENSTEATLTGKTNDDVQIQGSDTVKILKSKKEN